MSLFGPAEWTFTQNEANIPSPTTSGTDLSTTKPDDDQDKDDDGENEPTLSPSLPSIDEDDSDVSSAGYWEGQFETPQNRFKGSAATYRKYIAAERDLYDEVLQEVDRDLPSHLLAAHILAKCTLRNGGSARPSTDRRSRKQVKNPLNAWTRWPNRPEQSDAFDRQYAVTQLQECISAILQKQGRDLPGTQLDVQSNGSRALSTEVSSHASSEHSETADALSSNPSIVSPTSSRSLAESPQSDASQYDEPTYCVDQAYLDALTLPVVNHILSRLDQLLIALASPYIPKKKSSRRAKKMDKKAKSQTKRSLGDDNVPEENETREGTDNESDEAVATKPPKRRLPRDWSEVLGTASVLGWDSGAVDAAAKRCALLFDEDLTFITLAAGSSRQVANFSKRTWSLDDLKCPHQDCILKAKDWPSKKRLAEHIRRYHHWNPSSEPMPVQTFGGVHIDGYMQPIERQKGWREGTTREGDAELDATARREPSAVRSRKRRAVSDLSRKEG